MGSESGGEARLMRGELNRQGMRGWTRKKGEGLAESGRVLTSQSDPIRLSQAEAFRNSLADSVSFRFPSPPDHLCFFTPSAKSPRNSFRQTCGRTTKEILSPGRASVLSATERKCCGLAMILMLGR
jgi:hypothetical protein